MGRSPLCRKKIAAIVGAASIATMPVALAGPTTATPPPPIEPTTTTVPVPVQQPEQELSPVQLPVIPTPSPVQSPVVPIQPPVPQPVQTPVVRQPPIVPVQPPVIPPVQLPQLPSRSTDDAPVPSKAGPTVQDLPKRQAPGDVQSPGPVQELPPNVPPVQKIPSGEPLLPQDTPESPPKIQGDAPIAPSGEKGARLNPPNASIPELQNDVNGHNPVVPVGPSSVKEVRTDDRHGNSDGQYVPSPLPLPLPPDDQNKFPSWGHDHPEQGLPPVPVGNVNPPSEWHRDDWNQGASDEHGQPGHFPLPPPVVPDIGWHDPWLENCHESCVPPPNPDIFVQGNGNQVVIVNNITNNTVINNTVVNSDFSDIYLTNFVTGQTLFYPNIPYHHPWGMPDGWCNGHGGDWGWSAGVDGLYVGGGVFNIDGGCGYHPYIPPPQPLVIYYQGYQPYYVNNYYIPQGCGCVYANNTYYYYQQPPQEMTLPGWSQPEKVVTPYAWSPNAVTQAPIEGVPPFIYGTGRSPSYWWLLWLALIAGIAASGAWWYRRNVYLHDNDFSVLEEIYVPIRI